MTDCFVYDLPFRERNLLVNLLNAHDAWYDLGGSCLGYDIIQLSNFRARATSRRGETPADLLLVHWGQKNQTVSELFMHLKRLQLFQAMEVLRKFVPKKLHKYLDQPQTRVSSTTLDKSIFSQHISTNSSNPTVQSKYLEDNLNHTEVKSFYQRYRPEASPCIEVPRPAIQVDFASWVPSTSAKEFQQKQNLRDCGKTNIALNIPPSGIYKGSPVAMEGTQHFTGSSSLMKRVPSGIPETSVWLNEVSFEELKDACNNFDMESNLLGRGGFGEVYKGVWNGQEVAVKRIREDKRKVLGSEEFEKCISQMITELRTLMAYPARNILPLMAYSYDESFKTDPCLVYQLMANGSLTDRLRRKNNTETLNWKERVNIAKGTACGLVYLHANQITHVDIKSPNILLDEHLEPKIGDFGLVRWLDQKAENSYRLVSSVQGTAPYLPDDYIRSKQLSPAVDTFCFGIVLFELITARSPSWLDRETGYRMRDIMLRPDCDHRKWVDSNLSPSGWSQSLFIIGQVCAVSNRKKRPEMKQVFDALKKLGEFNFPPAYGLEIHQEFPPDHKKLPQTTNITDFTEALSRSHVLIPKILESSEKIQSMASNSAISTHEPSSVYESTDYSSSVFQQISESTTESINQVTPTVNNIKLSDGGLQNIPDFSSLKPDIPNLSTLQIDNGIPNLMSFEDDKDANKANEDSALLKKENELEKKKKSSIFSKLEKMGKPNDCLFTEDTKLDLIESSINFCGQIDDIL